MKKLFYYMFAAALSVSLLACEDNGKDDDLTPPTEQPSSPDDESNPGDESDEPSIAVKNINTIVIDDHAKKGFYRQIDLEWSGDRVVSFRVAEFSDRGAQGEPLEAFVEYDETTVVVSYDNNSIGVPYQVKYELNDEGYAVSAEVIDVTPGWDPWVESSSVYSYTDGMLSDISTTSGFGDPLLGFSTVCANGNWTAFDIDGDNYPCEFSDAWNERRLDLNMLMIVYCYFNGAYTDDVNFAVLCGLFPSTTNLMSMLNGKELTWKYDENNRLVGVQSDELNVNITFTAN